MLKKINAFIISLCCGRNTYHSTWMAVCILLSGICLAPALAGGRLIDLGVLPGYSSSSATGVSANGKVVFGVLSGNVGKDHAFRWTSSEGMTDLGVLPGGKWSRAFAASQNGTVVVGEADDGAEILHVFRWTRQTGMTDIGERNAEVGGSRYAVSNDGNLVSGFSSQPFLEASNAFRWTPETGMVREFSGNPAELISADGKVAVGSCSSNTVNPLCRWTESTGWVPLGTHPDFDAIDWNLYVGIRFSPIDISADGKVIVGFSTFLELPTQEPPWDVPLGCSDGFKWSESAGMVTTGGIHCAFTYSLPLAVSADGTAVVGKAQEAHSYSGNYIFRNGDGIGTFSEEIDEQIQARFFDFTAVSADGNAILGSGGGKLWSPFYWNTATGMRTISEWLIDNGIDVHKWLVDEGTEVDTIIAAFGLDVRFLDNFFFAPSSLSSDGNVVAGNLVFNGHAFFAEAKTNQPPEAICQNVTVAAGSSCTASASINNGSYDPDGDPIGLTQSPEGPYQLGNTLVTLTVTDGQDAASQCIRTVTVVDQTLPTITAASVNPSVLWPPNHRMVDVTVNYTARDNCGQPVCKISGVSSNESISSSDHTIVDAHHVKLTADRLGSGNGRVYTIAITCKDTSGNSSSQTVKVTVPHDQGR